ncbi:galactose-1-phosphate uridylyltransferase [Candidatus Woesearchaeota archaeon]|nr:galactose-1-phosphate uridylyltransferase [Candidatus Woesearchaeota archaeon]
MELRKDYILDRWVYIATGRTKRKMEFKEAPKPRDEGPKSCFFCPGNEKSTPPEKGRVEENGKWIIRWFSNKFPAVEQKGEYITKTANTFFTFSDAWGEHEVVVETNDHKKQLWDLDKEHIKKVLEVYNKRILELEKLEGIKYVQIFKNHGIEGGTSLVHSHTQLMALNKVPKLVRRKTVALKKYGEECPYCQIVQIEKESERRCFENNSFVAFCPYASRFNYEVAVMPKRHVRRLDKLSDEELLDFADILKKILEKLREMDTDYNFYLHYSPDKKDLHLQLIVCPRIAKWAGFELSSQMVINIVSPEEAAKFYRGGK